MRVISGCLIGAAVLVTVNFMPAAGVLAVLLALSIIAQYEFYALMEKAGMPVFRLVGTICGVVLIVGTFLTIDPGSDQMVRVYHLQNGIIIAMLIFIFVRQFPQKHNDKPLQTIACTLLGIMYVPFLLNLFAHLAYGWDGMAFWEPVGTTGRRLVLYVIIVVKSVDIGAYIGGRALGRHKMLPRISPGKTWEGFSVGITTGVMASWLFYNFFKGKFGAVTLTGYDSIILGLFLSVGSVVGDLFESLLKRSAGAKDSGRVVPGMGGLLDVLDSLLFGVPIIYIYTRLFL